MQYICCDISKKAKTVLYLFKLAFNWAADLATLNFILKFLLIEQYRL